MSAKRFEYNKDICCFIDNNEFQIKSKSVNEIVDLLNELHEDNEQLKQRINSRLHFYRELYETTNDDVVKRVIEDLEDVLR